MTIVEQLASAGTINIPLIIVLMAIGAVCKHFIKKLDNDTIPVILLITGIIIVILLHIPFNAQKDILNILVEGIASSTVAVGLHSQGKTIWTLFTGKNVDNNT